MGKWVSRQAGGFIALSDTAFVHDSGEVEHLAVGEASRLHLLASEVDLHRVGKGVHLLVLFRLLLGEVLNALLNAVESAGGLLLARCERLREHVVSHVALTVGARHAHVGRGDARVNLPVEAQLVRCPHGEVRGVADGALLGVPRLHEGSLPQVRWVILDALRRGRVVRRLAPF